LLATLYLVRLFHSRLPSGLADAPYSYSYSCSCSCSCSRSCSKPTTKRVRVRVPPEAEYEYDSHDQKLFKTAGRKPLPIMKLREGTTPQRREATQRRPRSQISLRLFPPLAVDLLIPWSWGTAITSKCVGSGAGTCPRPFPERPLPPSVPSVSLCFQFSPKPLGNFHYFSTRTRR
jgi:hypothetical protein